jgi:predicted Zn-dependent peptidase
MGVGELARLHRERYLQGPLIVAAAGFLEHDRFVADVANCFGGRQEAALPQVPDITVDIAGEEARFSRDGAQTHIVFGSRTPPRADRSRYPLILISAAFGGGMGSRLFQKIREELALGYTVYAFQSFHSRAGVSGVYVGTRPEWADKAVDAVTEEYRKLAADGLDEREFREVKDQVKGQVMLSLESTGSRLFRLAGFALYDQPTLSLDALLTAIEGVTREEISEVAAKCFEPARQTVVRLGPGVT